MEIISHFRNIQKEILKEIQKAKSTIFIALAYFTDKEIFETLYNKSKKGIKIELILSNNHTLEVCL